MQSPQMIGAELFHWNVDLLLNYLSMERRKESPLLAAHRWQPTNAYIRNSETKVNYEGTYK